VGLMSAAVGAWRTGESSRQVQERLQSLRRQIDEDFAAAILDPPPVPDFHYVLDTLASLPDGKATDGDGEPDDPYYIVKTGTVAEDKRLAEGVDVTAFYGAQVVTLKIRVPFRVGAALLKARLDVPDKDSWARLQVWRNDPDLPDPDDREEPAAGTWAVVDSINEGSETVDGAIGGGETDISLAARGGDIIFVKATLGENATFLEADRLRSEGRPVLILDCYRDADALPDPADQPRPTFAAWFEGGAQIVTFTRTIPGEMEKRRLREAGGGSAYLNDRDEGALKALGGRAQVVYRITPYADDGRRGLTVFRRAFEAPITRLPQNVGAGALRPNLIATVREMADAGLDDAVKIPAHDFIPSVLYLGFAFWGGETTTWEQRPELEPNYTTKYGSAEPYPRPASMRWLSSRYLPEQVQVTAVLEPDRGKRTSTGLKRALDPTATGSVVVSSTKGFYTVERSSDTTREFLRDPRHYIKIDDEWIYYDRVASETAFALPNNSAVCRGMRGTTPAAHATDAEVYRGVVSVFTVSIPSYRHWRR
ncbi:hypothetical protein HQ560_19730, partial [bacterium]|nr:hypothetical protein [bacterium]